MGNRILMNIKELVQATAKASGKSQRELMEVLNAFDSVVMQQLSVATPDTPVEVKILPSGVSVVCEYKEAHDAKNPATGEIVKVPAKKCLRGKIYDKAKEAVNQ